MAWKRCIPFGYRMEQAKIVCEPKEAETVKQIFTMYLNGCSMSRIAEVLSKQAVRYHAGAGEWNKNMIHRILENERYLGGGAYPKIIDGDAFLAVNRTKAARLHAKEASSEYIKFISKKAMCAGCGSGMRRHTKANRSPRWVCRNKECRNTVIIRDEELCSRVDHSLHTLAQSPQLLDMHGTNVPQQSKEVTRLENELTAAFNRSAESAAYMRELIFAVAAEKYIALPDLTSQHTMQIMKSMLKKEPNEAKQICLLRESVVKRILLRRGADVALELINGQVITGREEEVQ